MRNDRSRHTAPLHQLPLRLLAFSLFIFLAITPLGPNTVSAAQEEQKEDVSGDQGNSVEIAGTTADAAMSIDDQGRVGIGTMDPQATLDVRGTVATSDVFGFSRVSSGNNPYLEFISSPGSNAIGISTSKAERVRIDARGYVGIGTSTPTTLLTVGPDPLGTPNTNHLMQLAKANDAFMTVEDGIATALLGTTQGVPYVGSLTNTDFTLRTDNTERMRITKDGRIGIGTSTPSLALNVDPFALTPNLEGPGGILIGNSDTGSGGSTSLLILISAEKMGHAEIQAVESAGSDFGDLYLNPKGGKVIAGELFMTKPFNANKKDVQWDDVTQQLGYDNSSKRDKESIRGLRDNFKKILDIEPKTYTRHGTPDEWEIGYIAEEFAEAGLTRLVGYDQEGLPDYIHYDRISLYLTEVVKQQQQRIETLEHENEALRADFESKYRVLEGRLGTLEASLPAGGL